jgi:outer membrane protein TolC
MLFLLICTQIDSLSLNDAIDAALRQSPSYYESKIALDQSRILFYQSLSRLLPTVTVSGTYTVTEIDGMESSGYTGSANLNMPLFDVDVLSSIVVSGRSLKGSRIQHRADVASLILKLKTAYYGLINASALVNSAEIAIKRAEENLKLIRTRYELGAASRLEVLQGEVFHLRALGDRAQARTAYIMAHEELKSLLGTTHDIHAKDSLAMPGDTEFPSLDSLAAILAEANYSLQLARELRNIAHLQLGTAYLAFLPRVSLFYGYSYSADSFVFDFQHLQDNSVKNYGITLSLPVFELRSLIFGYLNAEKEYQKQEFTQKRIVLETEKSLRTTYYALLEAYERVKFAEKSLSAAHEATEIAREQYALGIISFLDFLTSEKDFYETRVSYSSTLSDFYIQRATLSYVLGELSFTGE